MSDFSSKVHPAEVISEAQSVYEGYQYTEVL